MIGLILAGTLAARHALLVPAKAEGNGLRLVRVAESVAGDAALATQPGAGSLLVAGRERAEWLRADGARTAAPGLGGQPGRIAAARANGNGFVAGEMFAGTDEAGGIARISPEGARALWIVLPGESGMVRALAFDDARAELIAATTQGGVWRIDGAGVARRVAQVSTAGQPDAPQGDDGAGVQFESVAAAPNDAATAGPWAGRILATAKNRREIYAIDGSGAVDTYDLGLPGGNNLLPISATENLFGVAVESAARASVYGAPASEFAGMAGDWLLTQRGGEACGCAPAVWRIHWNGAAFEKTELGVLPQVSSATEWGQVIFSSFGKELLAKLQQGGPNPLVGPAGKPAAAGADDLTRQESFIAAANGATLVAKNGNELPSLRFINTVFNNGDAAGTFLISAPTIPAGFSVVASGDSGATFSSLNNGGSVLIGQPIAANREERNIDVRVFVPAGTPINTDYDIVIQVTSTANTARFDRTTDRVRITAAAPPLTLTKDVTDENGGLVLKGDILKYSLTLKNTSTDVVNRAYIEEYVPANTTYIPGSVTIVSGANVGPKTDGKDADQADVYPPAAGAHNGQINVGIGAGAGGHDANGLLIGGTLNPNESSTVTFRVQVNGGLPNGTRIDNFAFWGANGLERVGASNTVTSVVTAVADPLLGPFGQPGAVGPTDNNDDSTTLKVFLGNTNNLTTSPGNVRFLNTLKNVGTQVGKFVISAPTIPAGFTVRVSVDSGASFVNLNNGGTATTPTVLNPNEERNLDVQVDVPAGLTVGALSKVVLQATWDADPTRFNRTIDQVLPDSNPPKLTLAKSVRDQSGNDLDKKTVTQGQTIEYTLTLRNDDTKPVARTFIAEYLPLNVSYEPGSTRITAGANAGAKTDQRGDDQVDVYLTAYVNGQINIFTGTGAASDRGGTLAPGESATVSFKVKVKSDAPANTVINNGADWGAEDFGIGGKSNIVTVTVVSPPAAIPLLGPFDRPDAVGPTNNNDDFTTLKVFLGNTNNLTTGPGNVRFLNTVKNVGSLDGKFVISAPTIPAGFNVRVSVDSGASFVSLNGGATATTPTSLNPGEVRNLDVQVDAPAGLTLGTVYKIALDAKWDADPTQANRTLDQIQPDPTPPALSLVKGVRDLSGNDLDKKTATQGQTIEYTLILRNNDNKPVNKTFIAEYLPQNVTYVANSAQITAGANAGAKTDKRGDDQVDVYLTAYVNGQINIFTGAGATSDRGGTLAPGESTTVSFRATVNANTPLKTIIRNGADWGAEDFGIGGKSNIVETTVDVPLCPIAIGPSTATLPGGSVGVKYSQTITATGTTGATALTVSAGALPDGLTLDPTTGVISGTPTKGGDFTFTITAKDSVCAASRDYKLTIICDPPKIVTQPADRQVCGGTSARFSVAATGTNLKYQWLKDGKPIAGATANEYVIVVATSAEVGGYSVVVTGDCGTVTSSVGQLTLAPFPTITVQPLSQTIVAGKSVTFTVAATGDGLKYQWRKGGKEIAGATSSSLTINAVATGDAGTYDVVVTGGCGSVTSAGAVLTVDPGICVNPIMIQPGTLPAAVAGTDYSVTFTQTGGQTPVSFSVTGALPQGLMFDSATGVLSGKPAASGTASFTIKVTDARGCVGSRDYTLTIDPSDACQATICFHSARYYSLNWGTSSVPSGSLLIGGVNFNNPVSTRDQRVKQALDGQYGELNRQYAAAQLSVLAASGLGAANITTALMSQLRCYGLDFDPTTVAGPATFTPKTSIGDFFLYINGAIKSGTGGRDACVLVKLLSALTGDDPANVCHRNVGKIDLSTCN